MNYDNKIYIYNNKEIKLIYRVKIYPLNNKNYYLIKRIDIKNRFKNCKKLLKIKIISFNRLILFDIILLFIF